jgi:hypothetical protein
MPAWIAFISISRRPASVRTASVRPARFAQARFGAASVQRIKGDLVIEDEPIIG